MRIDYKDDKLPQHCTDLKVAKKYHSAKVALKLLKLVNFIDGAENLHSVISFPSYHFHQLKGNKTGLYALDIDGRKGSERLIVTFDGKSNTQIFTQAITIIDIRIEEVSKHY